MDKVDVPQKKTYWKKRDYVLQTQNKNHMGFGSKSCFQETDASLLGETLTHFTPSYDDLVS